MRVLLIEDDAGTARSIELMLKATGFNVYRSEFGEEGIDLGKVYHYCQATSGIGPRIASPKMLPDNFPVVVGAAPPNQLGGVHGGEDQHARETRGRIGGCGALPSGRS